MKSKFSSASSVLASVLQHLLHHHMNLTKMFTRRNWLLRCSILINVAVILYICSHVMIGDGGNFATGPSFIIQDEGNSGNSNTNMKLRQVIVSNIIEKTNKRDNSGGVAGGMIIAGGGGGGGSGSSIDDNAKLKEQEFENNIKNFETHLSDAKLYASQSIPQEIPSDDENSAIMHLVSNKNSLLSQQQQQQQQPHQTQSIDPQPVPLPLQQEHGGSDIEQTQREISGAGGGGGGGVAGVVGSDDDKHFEVPTDLNEIAAQEKSQNEIAGQPDPVGFVNSSNTDGYVASGDEKDFEDRLRSILKCHDRDYKSETLQRGDFWVLKNYVKADHGELKCHETITYTTHADYTFLDNLIPLLERWNSPVSIAVHAPGNDFQPTINAIKYLRDCLPESNLVRQFVTFHIYFSTKHIPKNVPKSDKLLDQAFNCTGAPPFVNISIGHLYKTQKKLLYPVNVGRNIARDSAQTHFILASDIELYPNPGLVKKFLEMIARNDAYLQRKYPRVFPLSIFEVESSVPVPKDKTELQDLLRINKAIPFHKRVCPSCHNVPKSKEWMAANETEELGVFHIGKRVGYFVHWEPIYIGTHAEPHYDERLSWEGKSDKMTQGYALCVLDYEFHILDNAFLVHKPGIKLLKKDPRRAMLAAKTNQLIKKIIYPELRVMYGIRKGCAV